MASHQAGMHHGMPHGATGGAPNKAAAFAMLDHDSRGRVSFEQFRGMWLGEAGYVWV